MREQIDLFGATGASGAPGAPAAPAGLRYQPDLFDATAEAALVERIRPLPFKEFEFHGFTGKRRVVSFGFRYDYDREASLPAEPIPAFLLDLREIAARFAARPAASLRQCLVTEYAAGTTIGWHRDKPVYGDVIGISLLSPCRFRLRRRRGDRWERYVFTAEPRSGYLLSGPARHEWEHGIPPVPALRYSITFRQKSEADPSPRGSHA